MRLGRTEQPVFTGSVINRIRSDRKHTLTALNEARQAAVLTGKGKTVVSSGTVAEPSDDGCLYAFYRALNRMAASGGRALAVTLTVILPKDSDREQLAGCIDRFSMLAEAEGADIADVRSGVSANVRHPVYTVTCIGEPAGEYEMPEQKGGLSVIMTGNAGCEGTSILAHGKYDELLARFGRNYLEGALAMKDEIPAVRDAQAAFACGARTFVYAAGEGGILSALWDLSAGLELGLDIDLRAIPVRQETVEICEVFSLNPYALHAGGSVLILTDDAEAVAGSLEKNEIPYAVTGFTRSDHQKLLRSGEVVQCMNRPAPDALLAFNE